ncbi:hypothetical protein CDA56_07720 [Klebsiella michiganensis]|uniref:Uncharacterized protein n=1 Tax=Klebsiella michiganensis (strain ATCC 8724 / DSM 4798 / JCM 20051 / NBRC 3318 / NRRL B-199 / KCTC 1686 / BUCSAV 143 / CCM 1901) TaxID=1006551 RepID=A0A0H3HDB3_KLEM8|nr:hypothetical protein KOX_18825 [Klebsiella michiganensis KCTC 1686]AHW89200.1 hypothetical protein J415_18810 [Klebsiella michiganensis HKOPL1]AID89934.1 hypothetical protein KONIH1_12920 [Klebsiella oxytoca KONIH1]KFC35173.1 hypothetical protein FF19_22285 [Klebsiella michiganensis]PPA48543.1 hypothetical protein CDA56_07720 [Klebsiella michiganensis]
MLGDKWMRIAFFIIWETLPPYRTQREGTHNSVMWIEINISPPVIISFLDISRFIFVRSYKSYIWLPVFIIL